MGLAAVLTRVGGARLEIPEDVGAWRRTIRADLLERRSSLSHSERVHVRSVVSDRIRGAFPELCGERIGFYWPIRGEIDLRPLAAELAEEGAEMCLPVITGRSEPLVFARWRPGMRMVRGTWNIPVPAEPEWLRPTVFLIPVLGFDPEAYRLGYGGGYYDRTLSVMDPKPRSIGIGYHFGRLETIFPQPHDVPLDAVVTESDLIRKRETEAT